MQYLKLPIRFSHFFEKKNLPVCSIYNSICYNIHLLATTILGENKSNPDYGGEFWDDEFDIQLSSDKRSDNISKNLKAAITKYEKRLINVSISISVRQTEAIFNTDKHLKRHIDIRINGNIIRSNEPLTFSSGFFIGPYLFD